MVEAMEIPKGFKKTEVGIIPDDWDLYPIEDLTPKNKQYTIVDGPFGSNLKTIHYRKSGIPIITSGYVTDGKFSATEYLYVDLEKFKQEKRSAVRGGDIVMAKIGERCGASAILPKDHPEGILSGNALKITIDENRFSKELIAQILWGHHIKGAFEILRTTGAQPAISMANLKKYKIPLPPTKAEQAAIAEALNDADALITELEKLIAKKKAIKQGAMQELLKPKEGWEVEKLPELVWYQEGPGVRKSQFRTSGVKLLNGTNIERGELLLDKTDRFISNHEAYGWYSHFLVDDGDILIACSGISVDKFDEKVTEASSIHLPLCMNTSTMRFKVISTRITKPFFFHFLKSYSFKQQIGEQITGSAQLNFGPAHVKWVDINFPSPSEQNEIAQILSDMDAEIGAIVNSCVWDLGGDPFFFNTINEFHSLNNICQALRTM